MNGVYAPWLDFRHGMRIYGASLVAACLLWLLAPKYALIFLVLGSLASAEHVYRVRVHSTEARWRIRAVAMLGAMGGVCLLAAWLVLAE